MAPTTPAKTIDVVSSEHIPDELNKKQISKSMHTENEFVVEMDTRYYRMLAGHETQHELIEE